MLTRWAQRPKIFISFSRGFKVPAHFEKKPWNKARCMQQMPSDYDISLYESLGFTYGCTLDPVRDAESIKTPFRDWPTLMAMCGKIIAKSRNGGTLAAARAMPR